MGSSKMYITTASGILKTSTVVAGLIIFIMATVYFRNKSQVGAAFLFGVTINFLILSIVSLAAGMCFSLKGNRKYIDTGYHVVGGIFILVAGILILANVESAGTKDLVIERTNNSTGTDTATPTPGSSTTSAMPLSSTSDLTDEKKTKEKGGRPVRGLAVSATESSSKPTPTNATTSEPPATSTASPATSTASPVSPPRNPPQASATLAIGVLSLLNAILYFAVAAVSLLQILSSLAIAM